LPEKPKIIFMPETKKEGKNQKKIVFVVEDDLFLVQAYQVKFEKEKIEIWIATTGKEALAFLAKPPASVVLLDLMLPGLNGFEFLTNLRQNDSWKEVPVIVLTNLSEANNVAIAKSLGAKEYIVKAETKIDDVIEKVKKYL
jgi:two-component system OmpR family response regulator